MVGACRLAVCISLLIGTPLLAAGDDLGFEVPDGFEVSLYADDSLAHDIFSLTINSRGQVVVAGPGYVKILHDDNGDGRADRATLFSPLPAHGAQGMYSTAMTCSAPATATCCGWPIATATAWPTARRRFGRTSKAPTQGACGRARPRRLFLPHVRQRRAGSRASTSRWALRRLKNQAAARWCGLAPNGRQMEVFAHGFRNPYDLDFGVDGQLFTVDSDGEREIFICRGTLRHGC